MHIPLNGKQLFRKKQVRIFFLYLFFSLTITQTARAQEGFYDIQSLNLIYTFHYQQAADALVAVNADANTGATFQWQQATTAGGTFSNLSATGATYTPVLSADTWYRRITTVSGVSYYSNTVKYEVVSLYHEDINYIREHDVLKSGVTDWKTVDQLAIGDKLQTTTYLDGLGRPLQKVSNGTATPATTGGTWGDVVQFSEYDKYGRQPKAYLPYTSLNQPGKYKTTPVTDQASYYTGKYNETNPYSEVTEYYTDPLNRPKIIKSSGTNWSAGNGNKVEYYLNTTSDDVRIFTIGYNIGDIPTSPGTYSENTLYKTVYYNENNKMIQEFTNSSGQVILTKTQIDNFPTGAHSGWICVYSVYDELGLLRYRLQPEAVKYLDANGWSLGGVNGTTALNEWCFRYEYDEKGRNILKKAPGAKELKMLYDQRDRVVFMQDGNQRVKSPPEWTANLYDELDRPTITTLYHTTKSVAILQSDINGATTVTPVTITNPNESVTDLVLSNRDIAIPRYAAQNSIELVEGFISGTGDEFVAEIDAAAITQGYTVNTVAYKNPISQTDLNNPAVSTIVKYHFYDDYSFSGVKAFDNNFDNTTAYTNSEAISIASSPRTLSFPTGSMVRVLGTNTFLNSTEYYDEKGRHIQSIEDNIKSGKDVTTLQYSWDGRLMSTHTNHSANGGYSNFGILTKNIFDKIGRVTRVQKKYGTNSFKTIADYDFDDVGRLKTKHLAPSNSPGGGELESLSYSYNIQNNITGINKDYALKTPGAYDKWGHFFGLCLGYDKTEGVFNTTSKQLDGHVGGIIWNTMGDDSQRKYDYEYDNAGRLAKATFSEYTPPSGGGVGSWGNTKMDFTVTGRNGQIQYDLNGNLLFMLQKGVIPGSLSPVNVDDLAYTYNSFSNKLKIVHDNSTAGNLNGSFGDFKDGSNDEEESKDYTYDDNGNLIVDWNKNVIAPSGGGGGINYNFLDKPEQIRIAGKGTIQIVYDAEGNKLQKKYTPEGSSTTKTTTYINQFVYEGNDLQYINFEEGRIRVITPTSQSNGFDALAIDGNMDLLNGKKGAYDYFIRDYQENVRMILTEESHYSLGKCTMENERAGNEVPVFGQTGGANEVTQTRIPVNDIPGQTAGEGWQNSSIGGSVSRLSKALSKTVGPNSLLKVMAGDEISATSQYYYQNAVTNGTGNNLTTNVLSALVQALTGSASTSSAVKASAGDISNQLGVSAPFSDKTSPDQANPNGNNPKAYITVLFFDERFNFISEGSTFDRVTQAGSSNANITIPNAKAPKNGYAYIYVSNESNEMVYFDNLQVAHNRGRIIEENHYYSFGLKIAEISSRKLGDFNEGMLDNKNLYNDKELIDEGDLDWYDYGFRNYDPQIGRFPQLDPLTDDYPYYAPYQYAGNEPIANVDLDGLEPLSSTGVDVVVKSIIPKAASHAGQIALQASIIALNTGVPMGLDGVNTKINQPKPVNNTPSLPDVPLSPASYLSPANQLIGVDQTRHETFKRQQYLNSGWNTDGSEPGWSKLARNKTFTRASDNLVFPMIEGTSLLSGGGEIIKGIRMLRGATKGGMTTVGRWMSQAEYNAYKAGGGMWEGAGGQTFVTRQYGAHTFPPKNVGDVFAEFQVPTNSLLPGGSTIKGDWFKLISPNANKSMQQMLFKQGGQFLPTPQKLSPIQAIKFR